MSDQPNQRDDALTWLDQAHERAAINPVIKMITEVVLPTFMTTVSPVAGVAFLGINAVLSARAARLQQQNHARLLEEVARLSEAINRFQVDLQFIQSDEFTALTLETFGRNAYTHEVEKTRLFAQVLTNATTINKSTVPYKSAFLQIIQEVSVLHILILTALAESYKADPDAWVPTVTTAQAANITESEARAYGTHLMRFGLLEDQIGFMDYQRGTYRLTPYGRTFIDFVLVEAEQQAPPQPPPNI